MSVVEEELSDEEMEAIADLVMDDVGSGDDGDGEGGEDGGEEEEEDPDEFVHVDEKFYYLEYVIRVLGITHAFVSLCMLIAYYNLKVRRYLKTIIH